jgi:hypothetical protein
VDGAVDAAATKHRLVGRVHDRVNIQGRDVGLEGSDPVMTHSHHRPSR